MSQKIGDVCEGCQKRWEASGQEPKVLTPASGKTANKKAIIPLCSHCDGDAVIVTSLGNH